jgi:type IV secretory pathway ATPase VirB11/archaellum biosynthesis ATPase
MKKREEIELQLSRYLLVKVVVRNYTMEITNNVAEIKGQLHSRAGRSSSNPNTHFNQSSRMVLAR